MLACLIFLEKIQLTGINVVHLNVDYFKSKEKSSFMMGRRLRLVPVYQVTSC